MRHLSFVLFLMVSALPACAETEPAKATEADVVAALFYADWCGSCKTLEPKVDAARSGAELDTERVLFVRLDLTDEVKSHQAGLLADSLGLGEHFDSNAGATGYLLLVDAHTGMAIARLTKKMSADAIAGSITAALAATAIATN